MSDNYVAPEAQGPATSCVSEHRATTSPWDPVVVIPVVRLNNKHSHNWARTVSGVRCSVCGERKRR